MGEIKWIKLSTEMFGDDKIMQIRAMPDGDAMLLIWINLLLMAGRVNDGGLIYLTHGVPYTDQMLAVTLSRPVEIVQAALKVFSAFRMIEVTPDGLLISNWEKHQNIEGMEKVRAQARKRMADYRERKRIEAAERADVCAYCGKPADTVDHIVPRCKGGTDADWNLVPCCKSCNSSKSKKDLADFLNDSFYYNRQTVNHALVRRNEKLMTFVEFDEKENCYVTVASCHTEITRQNKNKNKKEEIYITNAPPIYDTTYVGNKRREGRGEENDFREGVSDDGPVMGGVSGVCENESGEAQEGSAGFGANGVRSEPRGGTDKERLDWRDFRNGRLH